MLLILKNLENICKNPHNNMKEINNIEEHIKMEDRINTDFNIILE